MQPYLVHIERENVGGWELVGNTAEGRAVNYRVYQTMNPVNIVSNLRDENYPSMETWYCRNEAEATMLAQSFATKLPGRTILITKVIAIAQATANPPVVSSVSEKGVLPR